MKLVSSRHIDIANLKGAVVTNTNGAEFYVLGFEVDVESHTINIVMQPTNAIRPPNTHKRHQPQNRTSATS